MVALQSMLTNVKSTIKLLKLLPMEKVIGQSNLITLTYQAQASEQ